MPDPAQQSAARAALAKASRELETDARDFTVLEVLRRRRDGTKLPFYLATLELPNGTRLTFQVSDNGQRVEPSERFMTSRI